MDRREALRALGPSGYFSGAYYSGPGTPETAGGAMVDGFMTALTMAVGTEGTFDRISISHFATVGSAGSVVRLGVFREDTRDLWTRVLDAGTVDTSTATGRKEIIISQALPPSIYQLVAVGQGAPVTIPNLTRQAAFSNFLQNCMTPRGANANFTTGNRGFLRGGITGALPSTIVPTRADFEGAPDTIMVWLRAA